jgi:hypothetical protein
MFAAGAVAREMILFAHAPLAQSSPLRPSDLVRQIRRLATAYLVMPAERDR